MRTYLVDGTNLVRRRGYDERFPEVEEANAETFLLRLSALASAYAGSIRVEIFFDGPRRPMARVGEPVSIRFPVDGCADEAIIGSVRALRAGGRGAVVVTADGGLAEAAREEGAKVVSLGEFESRLRENRV